jgi:hypothetical protein
MTRMVWSEGLVGGCVVEWECWFQMRLWTSEVSFLVGI